MGRMVPTRARPPQLTIQQILAWADLHHERTGRWPTNTCGAVLDQPGERWNYINLYLRVGLRGLPGKTTLARLLAAYRGARNKTNLPRLTIPQVLRWAKAHYEKMGSWPKRTSGPVLGAPGETWHRIDKAFRNGNRGLPGRSSLAQLLAVEVGARNHLDLPRLTVPQILAWADTHFAVTGSWPHKDAGAIQDAPGETWSAVDSALRAGCRGLQGGTSLFRLLKEYRHIPGTRPRIRLQTENNGRSRPVTRIELPDEWLQRFRSGELGPADLADMCGVSRPTAKRELQRAGVKARPQGRRPGTGRPAWHAEILRRYRSGQTMKKVAQAMQLRTGQVRKVLLQYGVALRPRGPDLFVRDKTPEEYKRLGQHLRALRRARGLTRTAVANRGGPSRRRLRDIEEAKTLPTRKTMRRLARALGVKLKDLVPWDFSADKGADQQRR
jgi:ribosome-binding protein aMBF1 (putative translation factor)